MGDLVFVAAIALIAGALGLGLGIVLSRTVLRRASDRMLEDDEEPRDGSD